MLLVGTVLAVADGRQRARRARRGAERLVSVQSNRYAYWQVAADVFAEHPLHGVGSGAFRRRVAAAARRSPRASATRTRSTSRPPPSSGSSGLAALAAFLAGIVLAARDALRREAPPRRRVAALAVFALHAGLDWDWELPALALTALLLAARLVAALRSG